MTSMPRSTERPRLHTALPSDERSVSWLELFFDLVYVVAIIQLGDVLASDLSSSGVAEYAFLFTIVWWSWMGTTLLLNRIVADDTLHRTLVLVQMFAMANGAIAIDDAMDGGGATFAGSMFVIAAVQAGLHLRVRWLDPAAGFDGPLAGYAAGAVLWAVSIPTHGTTQILAWVGATLVPLALAIGHVARTSAMLPMDREHLKERVGLLTIIVFGEAFVKGVTGLAGTEVSLAGEVMLLLGFVIVASLWWSHFDTLVDERIRAGPGFELLWLLAHLPLMGALAALGVGVKKPALHQLAEALPTPVIGLIAITTAVVLLSTAGLSAATRARGSVGARLFAAVLLLAVGAVGPTLPGVATMAAFAAICAAVAIATARNVGEHRGSHE